MDELISKEVVIDTLKAVRDLVWEVDIPSPTVPEYIEHHEQMQSIMRNIDILTDKIIKMPSAQSEQRWIPCSERMPESPFGCLVTVWDTDPITMEEFENILPYFVGWDGEQWNDSEGDQCPFEVIAWMPLPEPFKEDWDD